MLKTQIRRIVEANPEYADITPVIEKEILQHDIVHIMVKQGAMRSLTFIGGTSLRMCYGSSRLSEDLDFNGGHGFQPSDFDGLETDIQAYLQRKYETDVWVNKPAVGKQGNTVSWKIIIEKVANQPDLPRQKMHIDMCAIPSFDVERRALQNHYDVVVPTEGLLVPVQSLEEALVDKLIALAYRARRIKPRDIWDIVWIKQRGAKLSLALIDDKLAARGKRKADFLEMLRRQLDRLSEVDEVRLDFNNEMKRFIPRHIRARTLEEPDYWAYVQAEISAITDPLFDKSATPGRFDMGL